jgi:toxin FitB
VNYLLDTCILAELRKPQPNENVIDWINAVDEVRLCISVITLGEIQKGIAKLDDSPKKRALQIWLEQDLRSRFDNRIFDIDIDAALGWGILHGQAEQHGQPLPVVDCLLAATAIRHNLIIVTRNAKDFVRFPIQMLNPWTNNNG